MAYGLNFKNNPFTGALALDSVFPLRYRIFAEKVLNILLFLIFSLLLLLFLAERLAVAEKIPEIYASYLRFINPRPLLGVFFMLSAVRMLLFAINGFFDSKTARKKGLTESSDIAERLNYYAAESWYGSLGLLGGSSVGRLADNFPNTSCGKKTILRLGISLEEYRTVAKGSPADSMDDFINILEKNSAGGEIRFGTFAKTLMASHGPLNRFFLQKGITPEMIEETGEWVEHELAENDAFRRWWTRERLGRIPGLGKDWAYGRTPLLHQFTRDLAYEASRNADINGRERELKLLEGALLKQTGANVILVGEPGAGRHTVLLGLVRSIIRGEIFPELEHKRVFMLYGPALISAGKTKGDTEELLIKILNEAVLAGNIILAIDDFHDFVHSLSTVGISASEVLAPFLSHSSIHILGLADTWGFRKYLEHDASLMKYFERVEISEPDATTLSGILREVASSLEKKLGNRVLVTSPGLQKIAEGGMNYLVTGALPKRAIDLMEEVMEEAMATRKYFVTPDIVHEVLSRKTKMPLGEINTDEQQRLLGMEAILQKRVIGQYEAMSTVADAIRRARSGIQSHARPIGTFLFLGPTGVGKTETAKALAESYFGNEESMLRFDMTEYQTEEGLERLIGSFKTEGPGILASKITSSPYSVVLLDEFEKSNSKVKNLFLQILDEGFFSDYAGTKINMRNTIIVATSNAGSSRILEMMNERKTHEEMKKEIIAHIQKEGIMSPELLNRFDSIIIYRPLDRETVKRIARLMLEKLAVRLKQQNIFLLITEDLVEAAAKGGFDLNWGARPMQRFIKDRVEKIIADKIILGEIKPGVEFSLSAADMD